MDKQYFMQNLQLAQDGSDQAEAAIDVLFKEFDFIFGTHSPERFLSTTRNAMGDASC